MWVDRDVVGMTLPLLLSPGEVRRSTESERLGPSGPDPELPEQEVLGHRKGIISREVLLDRYEEDWNRQALGFDQFGTRF